MTCAVTTSFLGCIVTALLFMRYVSAADISCAYKGVLFVLFMAAGCLPLLVSYNMESVLGTAYPVYRYALYFIYILCVVLLTLTVLRDVVWAVIYGVGKFSGRNWGVSPLAAAAAGKANLITLGFAVVIAFGALYEGMKVPALKTVSIASEKIRQPMTAVFLSDLHIHRVICPEKIKKIVEKTNALKPDMIFLGGDILDDDVSKVTEVAALLKELKADKGIYFVTGNHEFYAGYKETVGVLKALGFEFLENGGRAAAADVFVAGVPDAFTAAYGQNGVPVDESKAFAAAPADAYKILLSHSPADFDGAKFDLEIAGHTHGGQIFPFHVFAKLHNKYLAGLYGLKNGGKIYVSRGAGQWGPQMRFLAPSEITVFHFEPAENKAPIDTVFGQGKVNPYARFFTGTTYLTRLSANDSVFNSSLANVTFEPKARTHWHKHSGGQILMVVGGKGLYRERGGKSVSLEKGVVVRIPPDVEHWHGAAPDSWLTHISVETNLPNNETTWLEPVTDGEYK